MSPFFQQTWREANLPILGQALSGAGVPGVKEGGEIAHSTYSVSPFVHPRVNVP